MPGTPAALPVAPAAALPAFAELVAPPAWRAVDFISDLHLEASTPATFMAWRRYMETTPADAVFILGDLFEVWVGDDVAKPTLASRHDGLGFEDRCARVMGFAATRCAVYFMRGNRDFLVGERYLALARTTLLADPTVLSFAGQRWLLTHGDALCLDDTDYMAFRAQVRSDAWQNAFLTRPLTERRAIARTLRDASEARKRAGTVYADVDTPAVLAWLAAANAGCMVHGHTHRPADHALDGGHQRTVLSDWDLEARPPRAEVLRLDASGLHRLPLA